MSGIELIAAERKRQVEVIGWDPEHDEEHNRGELAWAAVCYAAPEDIIRVFLSDGTVERKRWVDPWPWEEKWDKRSRHDRVKRLIIAGALIAAELDRIQADQDG